MTQMLRPSALTAFGILVAACCGASAHAATPAEIHAKAGKSLVVVEVTIENELRRQEITAAAVVVAPNIVAMSAFSLPDQFPLVHLKGFKVIVPRADADHDELKAEFAGRDERFNLVFLRLTEEGKSLTPITFVDKPVGVGDEVFSVSLLPKESGYKPMLSRGLVGASVRGEQPALMVSGSLAGAGGIVFDTAGDAVGYVIPHDGAFPWLSPRPPQVPEDNPRMFIRSSEILPGLADLPADGKLEARLAPMPFTGIMSLNGLSKDVSEVFGLTGVPAVEIGDVVAGTPAAKAGLEKGWIITRVNGKDLERGDLPEELGPIIGRVLKRNKVGDTVTFTVIAKKGEPAKDIAVVLGERPALANAAPRFYAEDVGFTVRGSVFLDRYTRKLGDDATGLVVDMIKPQSTAQTGRLQRNDFVTQLNGQPVKTVEEFKAAYETFRKEKPREAIVLQVVREGNTQIIRIEPPQ
jgi:S1-C subfamily serine protease